MIRGIERITIVHHEFPYPPDHGGKVDVWDRLRGLSRLGVHLQLVYWSEKPPSKHALDAASGVVEDMVGLHPSSRWRAAFELRFPPRVRRFGGSGVAWQRLEARASAFAPDVVLLETWPACLGARRLATYLQVPLIYRSQNIEHVYWAQQSRSEMGLRKLRLAITAARMEKLERKLRSLADVIWDISDEDAAAFDALGWAGSSMVLPPTWLAEPSHTGERPLDIDVLFVGNLWAPNNVEGIAWFSSTVLPLLRLQAPTLRFVIAGSRPSSLVRRLGDDSRFTCIADPEDPNALYQRSRVLINPLLSPGGFSVKTIEMVASGRPIVSTSAGSRGLPNAVRQLITVANSPQQFARSVLASLTTAVPDAERRRCVLKEQFGVTILKRVLQQTQEVLSRRGRR